MSIQDYGNLPPANTFMGRVLSRLPSTSPAILIAAISLVAAAGGLIGYKIVSGQERAYVFRIVSAKATDTEKPVLPDFSKYSAETVRAMIPAIAPGTLSVSSMDFPHARKQDGVKEDALSLESGVFDMSAIFSRLNNPNYLEKTDAGYTLKIPLYIGEKATLVLSGAQNALRLAADTSSFVLSAGKLYIVDSTVTGWNMSKNAPAVFTNPDTFRPYFYLSSNSESYIANSTFSHLGYNAPKSYGMTFSTSDTYSQQNPNAGPPRGWIVDSTFSDLYFGFYSYEAENVYIVHNLYKDNIIYGIDPHDRSRHLTIAENEVSGSKKKHGIIVSREVTDSLIAKNNSHNNAGSGIMIERNSRNNIVAWNEAAHNGGDGLSVYESPDTLSWGNTYRANGKSGIRIRNSMDVRVRNDKIVGNGVFGVELYTDPLTDQTDRDLALDKFEQRSSIDIADTEFSDNSEGQIKIENAESARFQGLHFFRIGKGVLEGDFENRSVDFYESMTTKSGALEVVQEKPSKP